MLSLEATHKRISSEIVDIFRYFLNALSHSSLADLAKKFQKSYSTALNKKNVGMLNQV